MDFHKLQQQLYDMDPTDPQEELRKLQEAARKPVDVSDSRDYITESANVAEGSLPLDIDSVSDFAALAGIRLDEKQKMGSAGQAKGSDPMPKTSKPSGTGEQKHPLKDKLVGEGPGMDAFKAGYKDYSSVTGLKKAAKTTAPKAKKSPGRMKTQQTPPKVLPPELAMYSKALSKVMKNPKLKAQFDQLMKTADPSLATISKEQTEVKESIKEQLWRALNKK